MATRRKSEPLIKQDAALRASISFPPELYHLLEQIASKKKVSLAWVIRDAAENYVAEQWPLLELKGRVVHASS
ncbi:MAG TPA: ribbon-helix-helix protein, CopG family [Usitatibacter sp.]|jgi:metal-responsive CopG/Arc/MetJ family transcriptional regulator|nr:ribbon-helix-helix protein, CopG family [Usitatibacter sp.]